MSYSYRTTRNSGRSNRYASRPKPRSASRDRSYIDPSRFIQVAKPVEVQAYTPTHTFSDFKLHAILHDNLTAKGYVTPTPIQDQAIPAGLAGQDVIGIASTGTGKTVAFALPVLQKLITQPGSAALIVAPTRELAQQIEAEFRVLARGSGQFSVLLIGGSNMRVQLGHLYRNPSIVIGTPGRIKDHISRGTLKLQKFNTVVLDEVDRMLDMGFVNDVTDILSKVNLNRQSFFFSATMDTRVRKLIDTFTDEPHVVSLQTGSASDNVHQNVVRYQGNTDKLDKLHDLLLKEEVSKVIVFDETQRGVESLSNELVRRGFLADAIHGGKTQGQRHRALTKFKMSEVSILVATDVAARGIDIADITHVVNYSIPKAYDDYVHRIGRAGRAGKVGHALTFVAG